jgi:hypothetical protein
MQGRPATIVCATRWRLEVLASLLASVNCAVDALGPVRLVLAVPPEPEVGSLRFNSGAL